MHAHHNSLNACACIVGASSAASRLPRAGGEVSAQFCAYLMRIFININGISVFLRISWRFIADSQVAAAVRIRTVFCAVLCLIFKNQKGIFVFILHVCRSFAPKDRIFRATHLRHEATP